jgi:hypothetical protein
MIRPAICWSRSIDLALAPMRHGKIGQNSLLGFDSSFSLLGISADGGERLAEFPL